MPWRWLVHADPRPHCQAKGVRAVEVARERLSLGSSGRGAGLHSVLSTLLQKAAKRLAHEDRARYSADPDFVRVRFERLTSRAYAAEPAKLIRPDRVLTPVYPARRRTTATPPSSPRRTPTV
jgi:gamma-glutamyltranspeptidase